MPAPRSSSAPTAPPDAPRQDAAFDAGGATSRRPGATVSVLLPLPLGGAYDYRAPDGLELAPGGFVEVPLGPRRLFGVVWDGRLGADRPVPAAKLKAVGRRLDAPPMRPGMRRLVEWVANYTLSAPGAVLRMAMSVPAALEPPRETVAFRLGRV